VQRCECLYFEMVSGWLVGWVVGVEEVMWWEGGRVWLCWRGEAWRNE
jgi:hypothetical protein